MILHLEENRYFDLESDIGIIGRGKTVTSCYEDAAYSLFSLMVDLNAIHPTQSLNIDFAESDQNFAFVTWLNQLLTRSHTEKLIFSQFRLLHSGDYWLGWAAGEPYRSDLKLHLNVKGATLNGLSIKEEQGEWEARCVVDID
ncbi:MAG TPA: archease [Gammaproteobacteria bacterium]|nr:archease [Gammaproteobacteria bacterium]